MTWVLAVGGAAAMVLVVGALLVFRARRPHPVTRLAQLAEHLEDCVVLIGSDDSITFANQAAARLAGRPVDAIVGSSLASWIHHADRSELLTQLGALRHGPHGSTSRVRGRIDHPRSGTIEVRGRVTKLGDRPDDDLALTLTDVVTGVAADDAGAHMFWDGLTGLPNREMLCGTIAQALARPEPERRSALLVIGIDGLRTVNEGIDLAAGDQVLRSVAERIEVTVRAEDITARVAGDTFAVLVHRPPQPEYATQLAHRLGGIIAMPLSVDERAVGVTASIGVVNLADDDSVESGLSKAETAMHRSKANGPGGVFTYQPSLRAQASNELQLRMELPGALHRGELAVVYQPIHASRGAAVRGSALAGFEALLRWPHLERGPVPPSEFIPAAEESGVIGDLGRWVLDQACTQAAQWNGGDVGYTMSVNVSGEQLGDPQLPDQVTDSLRRSGLRPELLVLELTESVLVDTADTIAALSALRALGVGLAIDDFGTGYSSLAYLQRFPVTRLKVDRAFVSQMDTDSGRKLVRSILELARQLDLTTVAEGVETTEQLECLADMGCDYVQGYITGRPAPAESFFGLSGP